MVQFENFRIGRTCPLLVAVKRLKPLTALSGTGIAYRLASCMSDHTPVLFNVFEDWNEESAVLGRFLQIYKVTNTTHNSRNVAQHMR